MNRLRIISPGESPGYDIPAAAAAAAIGRVVRPVLLAELDFASGDILVTDAPFDILLGGKTYRGVGHFGGISAVEESVELQAYSLTLRLNGIPVALLAIALGEHYQGRSAVVSLALLDEAHRPVDAPLVLFRGRMDVMRITAGETASIDLVCESRLADWERARVRRFNNADQQQRFPDDKGLEFVPQMVEKELVWPARSFFR